MTRLLMFSIIFEFTICHNYFSIHLLFTSNHLFQRLIYFEEKASTFSPKQIIFYIFAIEKSFFVFMQNKAAESHSLVSKSLPVKKNKLVSDLFLEGKKTCNVSRGGT